MQYVRLGYRVVTEGSGLSTSFHGLTDPLSGAAQSVLIGGGRILEHGTEVTSGDRAVDGSGLWILPAVYDADAHLPLLRVGFRAIDAYSALHGGIGHQNVALSWQLLRHGHLAGTLAALAATLPPVPAVTPVLTVDDDDTDDFSDWLKANADTMRELMAPVCKLYSPDPNFERNLEAVWASDLTAVVYCYDRPALDWLVAHTHGPLHHRHATSAELVDLMLSTGSSVQTSPHLLLPLADGRRETLTVLPPPPDDAERESLASVFIDRVALQGSDHNAVPPKAPAGPGLQAQQHLLQTTLAMTRRYGWNLADVWPKLTSGPSQVFGVPHEPGFVIVDPSYTEMVAPWPLQAADRAPFTGLELPGRVLAVGYGEHAVLV
jgi:hypothetical protein